MRLLRLLTAGESHGPQITAILDGMPAGLRLDAAEIAAGMARRQAGHGRGNRMKIEKDQVAFPSGIRFGETLGSPITMVIENRDHANWSAIMNAFGDAPTERGRELFRPRPGHADLVGILKYDREDARDILERASARETVARVAAGEICRALLRDLGVVVGSHVLSIGSAEAKPAPELPTLELLALAEQNDLRCAANYDGLRDAVDQASEAGDTVGGIFEVVVDGLPVGLGSVMSPDRRLEARLAMAILSVPAVKGFELGPAFENARLRGSEVHDEFLPRPGALPERSRNRAGGTEGGMSTGEPLRIRGAMKPISTLKKALRSLDVRDNSASKAGFERSDVCAVPAAGVVGEAVSMLVLVDALLEMFQADSMEQLRNSVDLHRERLERRFKND